MSKVVLDGGFYVARSLIADAQRCVNLYPERNPEDAPFPFTTYQTPGLTTLVTPATGMVRCLYRASTGDLYAVVGTVVYYVDSSWVAHTLGTIDAGTGLVSMADNRLVILIVDGTANGYFIDLTNNRAFGQVISSAFYGADRVEYLDTFFLLNQPGTANFYLSVSELDAKLINGGAILTGTVAGGNFYSNGTHVSVAMTGGTGSGAIADITVSANSVATVAIDSGGTQYVVGDVLTAAAASLGGGLTKVTITAGQSYTAGTYSNIALTGGTGSGAVATITVTAGGVSAVTLVAPGQNYVVGDILSASASVIGGTGSGFQLVVAAVATNGTGFTYTVTSINQGSGAFDPLYIAAKSGGSDLLTVLVAMHREAYLLGALTSEVWFNSGAADFPYQALSGVFWEHGCVAKYSAAHTDLSLFWLGQDKEGNCVVFLGMPYQAKRVSTHAIETEIQGYSVVSDAIGFCYQQGGHTFYQITFPTADKTWVYDLATEMWHERVWTDPNGIEHRHRANCAAFAYGTNVVGDWENGAIYAYDLANYTDAGQPIVRRRGFPHLVNEGKRLGYDRFIAEMDVGTAADTTSSDLAIDQQADPGGDTIQADPAGDVLLAYDAASAEGPFVSLRMSHTKGKSWGDPIEIYFGGEGEFATSMQARQLGMGRDVVFELFWSGAFSTALNGAYIDVSPAET